MMKRNILAVIVPALLVAGTANAAEIYNKDGNKVDLYGKAVGLHYFSKDNGVNSYGGNGDKTAETATKLMPVLVLKGKHKSIPI